MTTAETISARFPDSCQSCGSYQATREDGLCDDCGHAVDHHGSTVTDAYAVECEGCEVRP